jgi:histidinol-phosphate aminotransferase
MRKPRNTGCTADPAVLIADRAAVMPATPDQLVRDEIRALAAYHVPDSTGMVKLDAMENPYPLPPDMAAEIGRLASEAALNRYPDPAARELKERMREAMALPAGMDVLVGNGSDELIQVLATAVARPGTVLLGVEPSFVMFRMIATFAGMRYVGVPLASGFSLDLPALLGAIRRERPALAFIAYPNNPTGNLFDEAALEQVIEAAPGLVVIDEAYHAFARRSFLPRLAAHRNLLVMRTLSKLGLAGLRIGLLVGRAEWLNQLDKVRLPYNVSVLSQRIAAYVLSRGEVLEAQAAAIRSERGTLAGRLAAIPGVETFPSDANFILFRVRGARAVFDSLRARGVLIKNLDGGHPMLADCLRVTVGTAEQNERFLAALQPHPNCVE